MSSTRLSSSPSLPKFSSNSTTFIDKSTECAICYEPLEEEETSPPSSKQHRAVITLKCGHKWHLECITQQIRVGSMTANNNDKRLLLTGCQCGKCGRIFGPDAHPDLPNDILRSTDKLRSKVDALIDEHNLLQGLSLPSSLSRPQGSLSKQQQEERREALYREARRKYAFYLCGHCSKPYFGGTVACADDNDGGGGGGGGDNGEGRETRLCPGCAPQTQSRTICRDPEEHGRYLTWKCRYCCRPATTVCYGNVHFCESCHERKVPGVPLRHVSCPGEGVCPYPKPDHSGRRAGFHCNGPSQDCEQVYSCVLCDSLNHHANATNGAHHRLDDPHAIQPGSPNFLQNPSGQHGLLAWKQLNPRMSWQVEQHHHNNHQNNQTIPPLRPTPVLGMNNDSRHSSSSPITTNFVSSFLDCAMAQTVDLTKVLRLGDTTAVRLPPTLCLEVSARYTGRTDCPSVFVLRAILSDGEWDGTINRRQPPRQQQHQQQQLSKTTDTLEAPPGVYWERATLQFQLDTNTLLSREEGWNRPMVTVIVCGKDRRFWRGNYGSKVADITLRVVGVTEEELRDFVKTPEEVAADAVAAKRGLLYLWMRNLPFWVWVFRDGVLLLLLLLGWLCLRGS